MPDHYCTFQQLAAQHERGVDYQITYLNRHSLVIVLAPHGGGIETHTSRIARAIAARDLSYYSFRGIRAKGENRVLHITSHRFDEPVALQAVAEARFALSIHGHKARDRQAAMIGGRNDGLRALISRQLKLAGVPIVACPPHLTARNPRNIVNRCSSGAGVQVELTRALRNQLARDKLARDGFVNAVRAALSDWSRQHSA
jgi:phage replication-related protein YjqB (UPF0714/DUF867 family)